jgi:pimeloyl-ACP methyl ester carboxylesterase
MEYTRLCMMDWHRAPVGDGHPVIIFPGLGTNGTWAAPLKSYCRELGYTAKDWGRGLNRGPNGDIEEWLDRLADDVDKLIGDRKQRSTLIGWSLGGIYAREMAKRLPRRVRRSSRSGLRSPATASRPIAAGCSVCSTAGDQARSEAGRHAARRPAGSDDIDLQPQRRRRRVAGRAARARRAIENVEVKSSHIGLVWNPTVLEVIADRLSQREGAGVRSPERAARSRAAIGSRAVQLKPVTRMN